MGTWELWGMVEMFYVLIRMEVAQVYPFIKTTCIHKMGVVNGIECILQ